MKTRMRVGTLPTVGSFRSLLGLCLLAAVLLGGCADNRISYSDFLQMIHETGQPTGEQTAPPPMGDEMALQQLGPYKLGPDDVIAATVTVATNAAPVPGATVRVGSDGQVNLPMAGEVKVGGMTLEQAEDAIYEAFVPGLYKMASVNVMVIEPASTSVYVVGAVQTAGLTPLRNTERNLLFAVARAGGSTQLASGQVTLRRIRKPAEEVTVSLRSPEQLTAAISLPPLEQGDIVIVHAAQPNTLFVGGLVNAPGPQTYPPGTHVTLLQALASAGGVIPDLFPSEGTLIRRIDDKDVHVKLDLNRLSRGDDPNIALAAGDILWVPHTCGTRFMDFINRTVYLRAGASANYRFSSSDLNGDDDGGSTLFVAP